MDEKSFKKYKEAKRIKNPANLCGLPLVNNKNNNTKK
jgi:hypothetical protein